MSAVPPQSVAVFVSVARVQEVTATALILPVILSTFLPDAMRAEPSCCEPGFVEEMALLATFRFPITPGVVHKPGDNVCPQLQQRLFQPDATGHVSPAARHVRETLRRAELADQTMIEVSINAEPLATKGRICQPSNTTESWLAFREQSAILVARRSTTAKPRPSAYRR